MRGWKNIQGALKWKFYEWDVYNSNMNFEWHLSVTFDIGWHLPEKP